MDLISILLLIVGLAAGGIAGFVIAKKNAETAADGKVRRAEEEAKRILTLSKEEAETQKKEVLVNAKDEAMRLVAEREKEYRQQRQELVDIERRVAAREEKIEQRSEALGKREQDFQNREKELDVKHEQADQLIDKQRKELERIAGLNHETARQIILDEMKTKMEYELAQKAKTMEEEAKDKANQKSREVIINAIQRIASEYTSEVTVSAVPLPSEEIKGKIIGREGRNIRTFETATGVDLLVDDTPEVVTISCFDPVRREIGKLALEKLIQDGRIHPGRIDEVVEQATKEFDERLKIEGDQALLDVGLQAAKPELVKLLGRLRFRTSYGQNVLSHSIEVAMLAGHMATELGLDVRKAKRAGLLHDIGKAIDREREGSHDELGAEVLRKNGEPIEIIEAARLHHSDIPPSSIYPILVQAADAISASRPGARRESFEAYIQRLESLENIARTFRGVDKTYAIQAGREIRVIVKPKDVDDVMSYQMARDIAAKIENELTYPGTIRVTVIREVRYTENAK